MITNGFWFILFAAITILFIWLAWRAFHAGRVWVRILGGAGSVLLALIFAAVTFFGGKGYASMYYPNVAPAPDITVARTPEQLSRGEYLVNVSCVTCHGAVDAEGNPTRSQPLTGGWKISQAEGLSIIGDLAPENLTPGGKLATYTDGELFRALRHGVDKDGRRLGFMSLLPYHELSDDDIEAIIAYLRSLPPVATDLRTGDNLSYIGLLFFGAGLLPSPAATADTVAAPPQTDAVRYGKYVATFGECRGCHGEELTGSEATMLTPAFPNPRLLVSTLDQQQFMEMMRSGIKPDGVAFPERMPWENASRMSDADLAALYAYLTAVP